jgi:hypothetical protein
LAQAEKDAGDAKSSSEVAADAAQRAKDASGDAITRSDNAKLAASGALTTARGARKEADSYEKDIVSAKEQAAEAESHLAEAMKEAVAAKESLATFRAPRVISEADKKRWVERLAHFPDTPFDLVVGSDSETIELLKTVQSILVAAKWKQIAAQGPIGLGGSDPLIGLTPDSGVLIEANISRGADWGQQTGQMQALWELFLSSGIPAKSVLACAANPACTGVSPNAIHIFIGIKPR